MNKVFISGLLGLMLLLIVAGCSEPDPPSYPVERLEPAASTTLKTADQAFEVRAATTPQGFFDAHPVLLGRGFVEPDHQPDATASAVLTHGLWERLGSSPSAVGSTVYLNGEAHRILGITAKDPELESKAEILLPRSGG